jgi:hypothetical protein
VLPCTTQKNCRSWYASVNSLLICGANRIPSYYEVNGPYVSLIWHAFAMAN